MSDFEDEKKRREELNLRKDPKLKDRLDKIKPEKNIDAPSAPIMPCVKCHKSHKKGARCPPR
jgi:hypothetical protein